MAKAGLNLAQAVWARNGTLALLGIDTTTGMPVPQLVLAVDAGEASPALLAQVEALLRHAAMFTGPTELGARFNYIAGQTLKSDPANVLVYCTVEDKGGWVLTVDGTVRRLEETDLQAALDAANNRLKP